MNRMTKKVIITAVAARTGVKPEYIDLYRNGDGYFWAGKAGACFVGSEVFALKLSELTLKQWVQNFEAKQKELLSSLGKQQTLNEYIESIDWNVEYED